MRFHYSGKNKKISRAVTMANIVCEKKAFYNAIAAVEDFDLDNTTPPKIADAIYNHSWLIYVKTYWKPFSPANAYFTSKYPNAIHINTAKLGRSDVKLMRTVVHEGVHVVDHHAKDMSFGHGGNLPQGKGNTAPYAIGAISEAIAISINLVVDSVKYVPTIWQRVKNFFRRLF